MTVNLPIHPETLTVRDTDLAQALGYRQPRMFRNLIKRHLEALKAFGNIVTACNDVQLGNGAVRAVEEFHLNRKQAVYLCTQAGTPKARAMSTNLMTYTFDNTPIRVTDRNGDPWFLAADVCDPLGYSDTNAATRYLDPDEVSTCTDNTTGQVRHVTIISESGLYSLVLRSRKPEAKRFKKWVTSREDFTANFRGPLRYLLGHSFPPWGGRAWWWGPRADHVLSHAQVKAGG